VADNQKNRLTAASRLAAGHAESEREERRDAIAALLATPLLTTEGSSANSFRLVRIHASWLKDWFLRWPGWSLIVAADVARLRKHSSAPRDASRGLIDKSTSTERNHFTRRKYAMLCLVLATLENEQRQTTIQQVAGKTTVSVRINPLLQDAGFEFDAKVLVHRRELVAVMRFLQQQNVLIRADGDDSGYVKGSGDCLYRIDRAALSTILCSVRAASTISGCSHDEFVTQLNEQETPESTEAQNRQLQHVLVRRLLDDPVLYYDELTTREYEYFNSQGERLIRELVKTTGMIVERRAEGVALLDPNGDWTDLGLPETGTRGHATLLLAEWFGDRLRENREIECRVPLESVHAYVNELSTANKNRWRKNADTPDGVRQILKDSLNILTSLSLIEVEGDQVIPRPAVARYRLDETV